MINPIKAQRLLMGLSQDALARLANVTHDNIVRNEQGLYNQPSPRVAAAVVDWGQLTLVDLHLEYTNWVHWRRRQEPIRSTLKRQISLPQPNPVAISHLTAHPFVLWRLTLLPNTSRIAFCQMLCVHPATVLKYEKAEQRTLPSQIRTALLDAGLPPAVAKQLNDLGELYFLHIASKRRFDGGSTIESESVDSERIESAQLR